VKSLIQRAQRIYLRREVRFIVNNIKILSVLSKRKVDKVFRIAVFEEEQLHKGEKKIH
jgi:hypothetical protein